MLKLEPITDTNELSWLYSLNKKFDSINIDLFINITKSITSWNIDFELVICTYATTALIFWNPFFCEF